MANRIWPNGPQTQYFYQPGALYQGTRYAHDARRDYWLSGYIRDVPPVSAVYDVTVTWGVDGDAIAFTFDGVSVPALALTDDPISAGELQTAVAAYAAANPDVLSAVGAVAGNVFPVTFADALAHDVPAAGFATGTSAVAQAITTPAETYGRLQYGLGVTLDPGADLSLLGTNLRPITMAIDASSQLLGVLSFEPSTMNSEFAVEAAGYDPTALLPGRAYEVTQRGSVVVPWVGTLPTLGAASPVFWINAPASNDDRGKFRSDANGEAIDVSASASVEGLLPGGNLVKLKLKLN